MEYNSFYGGRRGASFIIAKSFKTEEEMIKEFAKGGQYKAVNYDEYVIIDTENKNDITNGKIYRRGYDYTNNMGGAEYIGQIVGPAGLGPHAEIIEKSEVNKKYIESEATGDKLDYRYGKGTLDIQTNDLVPGAKGEVNNRTFDDDTDKIHWEYFSLRDDQQLESTCYIGYQVPYTVFDFFTKAVDPYDAQGNYADMTAITRQALSEEHPFYEQWEVSVPKGVKGDMINNFKLYTPGTAETMADVDGTQHSLAAGKTVLVYDYWTYDNKKDGEKVRLYLGEYEVIDDITIGADGTVTIIYKSNRDNTVFNKRIQWIDSITLTQEGLFTVNYNNGAAPYKTNLVWVRDLALAEDGTITLTYNNKETIDINTDYKLTWIKDIALANSGELTVTYNNEKGTEQLNIIQWVVSSSYNAEKGELTFTYNTGKTETYEYKYIGDVSLDAQGNFIVKDNTGAILLDTDIIFPTKVELVDGYQLVVTANNGTVLLNEHLKWVEDLEVAADGLITLTFNDGTTENLDNKIKWIVSTNTDEHGVITITWNDGSTTQATGTAKWIDDIALADNGKFTITYNDGQNPVELNTIKWLTGSSYNNENQTLTFTYNTGLTETYEYKYISNVNLTDTGVFTVVDNSGTEILNKIIEYPTAVELVDGYILKVTANTGNILLEQNLQWVKDITIEDDRFKLTYNNGTSKVLDDVLLNQIEKMSIPTSGDYMYHMLVYYSAIELQGTITWDNITGWIDLGSIKDYNGVLIGMNIDTTDSLELEVDTNAIDYLNETYPNGIVDGSIAGKVVTMGRPDMDKRFYAYDYQNNEWFYLGNTNGVADIRSTIAGPEDASTYTEALKLPTGSLWFVIEGDE